MSYGPVKVFTKGPYKGESWEKVLELDPEYLMVEMMDKGMVINHYQASLIQGKFHRSVNKKYIYTPHKDRFEPVDWVDEDFDTVSTRFESDKGYGIDGELLSGLSKHRKPGPN